MEVSAICILHASPLAIRSDCDHFLSFVMWINMISRAGPFSPLVLEDGSLLSFFWTAAVNIFIIHFSVDFMSLLQYQRINESISRQITFEVVPLSVKLVTVNLCMRVNIPPELPAQICLAMTTFNSCEWFQNAFAVGARCPSPRTPPHPFLEICPPHTVFWLRAWADLTRSRCVGHVSQFVTSYVVDKVHRVKLLLQKPC